MQIHICRTNFSTFNNEHQIVDSPVGQKDVEHYCALTAFNYKIKDLCQNTETFITMKALH